MRAAARSDRHALEDRDGEAGAHHVIQGEHHVSGNPDAVLTTILGSCVAACVRDPVAGVGGMNHFLLPGDASGAGTANAAHRYGVHLMELLVNALLQRGAVRSRLEAKLFGGAKTIGVTSDVGGMNASFAADFLRRERIAIVGECLRGTRGRRVQYWPVSGRARRIFLADYAEPAKPVVAPPPQDHGTLDLF